MLDEISQDIALKFAIFFGNEKPKAFIKRGKIAWNEETPTHTRKKKTFFREMNFFSEQTL